MVCNRPSRRHTSKYYWALLPDHSVLLSFGVFIGKILFSSMNIPTEIIEKAIEGGWYRSFGKTPKLQMKDTYFQIWEGRTVLLRRSYHTLALDPTFWQALGHALNWGRHMNWCRWESSNCEYKATHFFCPHSEHECNCHSSITWQIRAESFFHRLMVGMPTEAFWAEILTS